MKKAATMKEVAERAGVSLATVSRVLNGSSAVSIDKRRAVMDWIRRLDYRPNTTAQTLARKRAYLIGVVLPEISNPFFAEVLHQIEASAFVSGFNVVVGNFGDNAVRAGEYIHSFLSRQVDGVILCPGDVAPEALFDKIPTSTPSVAITQPIEGIDSVFVSMEKGGELAARHLVDLGHERIAFLGRATDPKYAGFSAELERNGITVPADYLLAESPWGEAVPANAYAITKDFFRDRSRGVTALFAANDYAAFGALHALQDLDIPVPEEVAIIGFDNTYLSRQVRPTLTSIGQPTGDLGRIAIETLLHRLEGTDDNAVRWAVLEPRLIARQSTTIHGKAG